MTARDFEELAVADNAERTSTITAETVTGSVSFSGDDDPSYTDPAFAAAQGLGQP